MRRIEAVLGCAATAAIGLWLAMPHRSQDDLNRDLVVAAMTWSFASYWTMGRR